MLLVLCWFTGGTIVSAAQDLGLGESAVGRWIKLEGDGCQAVREGCPGSHV